MIFILKKQSSDLTQLYYYLLLILPLCLQLDNFRGQVKLFLLYSLPNEQ